MNRPLSPAPVPALTGSDLHLPLNFVAGGKPVWPEISRGDTISIDATLLRDRCNDGFACWILQTYVLMRQAGLDPTLSTLPRPDAVNVVHPFFFGLRHRGLAYILACRADAHEPWAANFWLDQNGARGEGPRHAAVPHWPQPGLMPRDPRRGTRIETLVFKGEEINFDPASATPPSSPPSANSASPCGSTSSAPAAPAPSPARSSTGTTIPAPTSCSPRAT